MKIAHIVPGISPNFGGPSVALIGLAHAQRELGVDAEIITTNADPAGRTDVPLGRPVEQQGARVTYYNVWPRGRYAFSPQLARALAQSVREYDLLHVHWLYNFSPLLASLLAARAAVPYVLQPNGSLHPGLMQKNALVKRAYLATLGRFVIRNASGIIFTSEAERDHAGVDCGRVPAHVVPVGLRWQEYAAPPPPGEFRAQYPHLADKRIVLFLGRVGRQKGLDLLVPAFQDVARCYPDAHLVIAGPDGEGYRAQVEAWVAEAGLESRVTFTGRLEGRTKLAAYVDCNVFVLSSHGENFGAAVTEAMACGKPVVVSDRVDIAEEIVRGGAGVMVSCTPESVAAGLSRLLDDPALAAGLGERGRALIQRKFTWEAAVPRLIGIYESVLERGR